MTKFPAPLDANAPTLSSICDRDDLDSEYIVWNGHVTTIDDLESLGTYTLLKGSIIIHEEPSLEIIDLPELQIICGNIDIFYINPTLNNTGFHNLNMPQLKMINGISISSNDDLTRINLPQLQTVTEQMHIYGNDLLQDLTLSQLEMVGKNMTVAYNDSLENLNLPQLKMVEGEMTVDYNYGLITINSPKPTNR